MLFASTTKKIYISYPAKQTFGYKFLTKSLIGMGVIVLHQSRGWKYFLYVYVCVFVCNNSTDCNFYPIGTKFDTQVRLAKRQFALEDGLCRFHRDP